MGKVGLVLEGGAFRGIFTAGALDCLLDRGISFPYVIGVSAGSGNAVNYIAKQKGRTRRVIMHENADPFYGLSTLARRRKLLDLDLMLSEYAYEQIPLDFETLLSSETESEYVAVSCETGKPEYLSHDGSAESILRICKATCSVPFVCRPVEIGDSHYLDGSIVDSIPFMRALERGCERVVVILTRPEGGSPTNYAKVKLLVDLCYRKRYPQLAEALLLRHENHEKQMKALLELEAAGNALVLRPTETIGHFENDAKSLLRFYRHGYATMKGALPRLADFIGEVLPLPEGDPV